jgi:hypothetical protein
MLQLFRSNFYSAGDIKKNDKGNKKITIFGLN